MSSAITETLERFFGTDAVCFAVDSNVAGLFSPVRGYERFSEALRRSSTHGCTGDALPELDARRRQVGKQCLGP